MSRLCVHMFPISPDYSGAASALFDLGGIAVMHDASGCTGNYTGYDEPRWLGSRTAVYCSGLRRMDAVLGNDEKYIRRTVRAAKELDPSVICLLGSPVPILIGADLQGMAREIEEETGIPSFGFGTSGQGYYDKGASDVFLALTKRFCRLDSADLLKEKRSSGAAGKEALRVNLLGMLPLDFGNQGNIEEISTFLEANGMEILANYAYGLKLDRIRRAALADWNLVMSRSGLKLAEYMEAKFGIPYFCGVPAGDGRLFLEEFHNIRQAREEWMAEPSENKRAESFSAAYRNTVGENAKARNVNAGREGRKEILIIHEQVFANSLRKLLEQNRPELVVRVGSLVGLNPSLKREGDLDLNLEEDLVRELNSGTFGAVIGDPELARVIRGRDPVLIPLPHVAVSSKLHWEEYPSWLGSELPARLQRAAESVREQ